MQVSGNSKMTNLCKPRSFWHSSAQNLFTAAATRKLYRKMFEVTPNKFTYYGLTAERTEDGSYLCGSCPYSTNVYLNMRVHLNETHKKGTVMRKSLHPNYVDVLKNVL